MFIQKRIILKRRNAGRMRTLNSTQRQSGFHPSCSASPGSSPGVAPIVGVARGEGAGPGGDGAGRRDLDEAEGRGLQSGADRPDRLQGDRGKCRATVGPPGSIPPVLLFIGGAPRGHGAGVEGAAETRAWAGREARAGSCQ